MKVITRTVWILSLVSMFADIASEMLYPVIPVYLQEAGFSVLLIGILEGVAEFTAGISKGYFGKRSDEAGRRLPFIKLGYFFSAVSKPMMGLFVYPIWIFLSRTTDRLGKGLRTAARDALLSAASTKETKARVFGFHRGLDTLGAVLGPSLALLLLYIYPGSYRFLFFAAFIPGIISVAMIFLIKEGAVSTPSSSKGNFFSFFRYWQQAGGEYKQIVPAFVFFALFNSSDIFLVLKTREITGDNHTFIIAYIFYNLVYALASYPLGSLADRWGIKKVFVSGLILFALVYLGFGLAGSTVEVFTLFFFYGIFAASSEGVAKAWITNLAHEKNTATAIGFYTSCQSLSSLLASVTAGFIWVSYGSNFTFWITASASLLVALYLLSIKTKVWHNSG